MELTRKALLDGNKFIFSTPEGDDDLREATIEHEPDKNQPFRIWFNGALIHSDKRFTGLMFRLDKLKLKWDLSFSRIEEPEPEETKEITGDAEPE